MMYTKVKQWFTNLFTKQTPVADRVEPVDWTGKPVRPIRKPLPNTVPKPPPDSPKKYSNTHEGTSVTQAVIVSVMLTDTSDVCSSRSSSSSSYDSGSSSSSSSSDSSSSSSGCD